jgi:hypothetical protein
MDVSRNSDLPAEQSATEAVTGVTLENPIRASRGTNKYILYICRRKSLGHFDWLKVFNYH